VGRKIDSLMKLMSLGLNTPEMVFITSQDELDKFLDPRSMSDAEGWEKVSIRTDNKEHLETYKRWGLPFFPNKTMKEAQEILKKELSLLIDKIDIIIAKGIDPKDTLMSGKYLRDYKEDVLEYVLGSSTVRDIDRSIPKVWIVPPETRFIDFSSRPSSMEISSDQLEKVGLLPHIARRIVSKEFQAPFVLEFSIYPYPIGLRNRELIFWEVIEEKRKNGK